MKRNYKKPVILQRVTVRLETDFLQGSVVTNDTKIETAGQTVEKHEFNNSGFNSVWE